MDFTGYINSLPSGVRIIFIIVISIAVHFVARGLKRFSQWAISLKRDTDEFTGAGMVVQYPKFATILTIFVSAVTFMVYFMAFGLILQEFNISLKAYMASASVIGLAIGFGAQGFVQDVVIGLTLIFSNILNVGQVVGLSDQVGKVEQISLRFTKIVNLHRQEIYIPNRNINMISLFRGGCIRAYVDIQLPEINNFQNIVREIESIANGMYHQHKSIILSPPENLGVNKAEDGLWRFVRIKFKIWPGQNALIETTFKQRLIMLMKRYNPDTAEWMVTVTYRVE